jgi:hypothetical protein
MTTFFRLLAEKNKGNSLLATSTAVRVNAADHRVFGVSPESFHTIPGAPFAYWVSENVRESFKRLPAFDGKERIARITNPFGDNNRFLRTWWEVGYTNFSRAFEWVPLSKGGAFSPYYYDVHLLTSWNIDRQTYHGFVGTEHRPLAKPACVEHFFRPGLTWPSRANGLSFRVLPKGCIFAGKGPAAFALNDDHTSLLVLCALANSLAFGLCVAVQLARTELAQSFEVGLIQQTPVPDLDPDEVTILNSLSLKSWSLMRKMDSTNETSHAFLLPLILQVKAGVYSTVEIEAELAGLQAKIDEIAFDLYGFSEADRVVARASNSSDIDDLIEEVDDAESADDEAEISPIDQTDGLLSWAAGVAFGRFDWRLATGEREAPPDPDPFDPLPAKSLGMLPDDAEPFYHHAGILVDDPGHPHDLAHLVEEVLARVDAPLPSDVRRWLQRDFFPFHLQNYSKSRRKAPIYWPLATASSAYTLWLYYPSLTNSTLYTAVNDFIEGPNGKLNKVEQEAVALRNKGSARSRDEDKKLEALQALESELTELRDTLLRIAPTYHPNHDDGVQITAAPLWPLFCHKPWQKLLKDTWTKLEKGEYDWAHLALAYWPERVREKCKTDKSLAIAHDLETLYVEPEPEPKPANKRRGAK